VPGKRQRADVGLFACYNIIYKVYVIFVIDENQEAQKYRMKIEKN
jgi:hypothetical protein